MMLPIELQAEVARHLDRATVYAFARTSRAQARSLLPTVWARPWVSPLAGAVGAWRRFLDALAASRHHTTALGIDYAACVRRVDDLGLFVGAEDCPDDGDDTCTYVSVAGTRRQTEDIALTIQRADSGIAHESDATASLNCQHHQPQHDRRRHLLKSESVAMISEYPRDSLHYALALLLTHCENINHVNLQLPLPVPLSDFPLKLCLMPGLRCLEITTRVTDSMLRAIFSGAQEHGLRELRLTRPSAGQELTGAVVAESLQRLHPGRVERLVLPSVIQRSVGAASCGMPTRMPRTWLYAIPAAVVSHTVTMMHVMPVVEKFSRLLELDISVLGASIPKGCTFDALEAVSKLSQLRRLTLSLSKSGGIGVPEICTQILPCLRELRALTLKASLIVSASMSGYDYVGDGTVEEEELMLVPRYWCGPLNVPAAITLVGLDMVRGSAEGVMRAYYSCAGGDAGMLGDFRQRWELLFAPNFALAFRNE